MRPRKKRNGGKDSMKREDLKAIGLTDEQVDKVMAEHGKDIETHKTALTAKEQELTAKTAEVTSLTDQIKDRDKQLDDLKKVDAAGLQAKIAELQGENSKTKSDYEAQLKQIKLDSALESKLRDEKAVNVKAVKALLDHGKITFDGETLTGVDEQLKTLKESEKWAFAQSSVPGSGGNPPGDGAKETTLSESIVSHLYPKN